MKLYLVRHGQSEQNADERHQHAETPLSEEGFVQSRAAANRLASFPIDIIITSPFPRARQTGDVIKEKLGVPLEQNDLLHEIKRPKEIEGKSVQDLEVQRIKTQLWDHLDDPMWHFSDEENYFDVTARIKRFVEMLDARSEKHIVIVSHAVVLKILMMLLVFAEQSSPIMYRRVYGHFGFSKCGITMIERVENGRWVLEAWNEHAHLLEDPIELYFK